MYFVIQVTSRTEEEMIKKIKLCIDSSLIEDIFCCKRERCKKVNGKWIEYKETCFPGYIFVSTSKPSLLARELRNVEGFSRLVGFGKLGSFSFMPLSEDEEKMINHLIGKNNVIELSTIEFEEGNKVKIIDGPLIGLEGQIVKFNFHKRVAYVNINFGNTTTLLQLGIDMIEKEQ